MGSRYLAPSVLIHGAEVSPARYPAPALVLIPTPLRTISCARVHHQRSLSCARDVRVILRPAA